MELFLFLLNNFWLYFIKLFKLFLKLIYLLNSSILVCDEVALKFSIGTLKIICIFFVFLCSMHQFCYFLNFIEFRIVDYFFCWSPDFAHIMMTFKYLVITLMKSPSLFIDIFLKETEKSRVIIKRDQRLFILLFKLVF